jgi:endoglucanase
VADQITNRDLYTIINIHHDSSDWLDFSKGGLNAKVVEQKFTAVWRQIATKFQCSSNLVAFEPLHEARGSSKEEADTMNRFNKLFVDTVNETGGFNKQRVLTLVGLGDNVAKTSKWFKKPEGDWKNPWALQYHFYSPCKLYSIKMAHAHGSSRFPLLGLG